MTIELAHARAGVMGFDYIDTVHPFVVAAQAARAEANSHDKMRTVSGVLQSYYGLVQPNSALEVVDLEEFEAPGLIGVPTFEWVFPWTERSIEDNAKHRKIALEEEGLANWTFVLAKEGQTLFGPVSQKKLALESTRLTKVAQSIERSGIIPERNTLEVIGLRAGGEYRWLVVQGQHRLAACATLGFLEVPVRVRNVVAREEVEGWPHVTRGTFTRSGALECFDRVFNGTIARCAAPWLDIASRAALSRSFPSKAAPDHL